MIWEIASMIRRVQLAISEDQVRKSQDSVSRPLMQSEILDKASAIPLTQT
jgi:hypothetical protein